MEKNKFVFKWHRNSELSLTIHLAGFFISLALLLVLLSVDEKKIILIILIGFILLNIAIFVYSFYYGWNIPIYFDNEKICAKMKGKNYEWRWKDMTDCRVYCGHTRIPQAIMEITTDLNYKKLTFSITKKRFNVFMNFCPSELIKEKLKKSFEDLNP